MDETTFGKEYIDGDWGCVHKEVQSTKDHKIKLCQVNISDLQKIAEELSNSVLDSSWMMNMDAGAQQSYRYTAKETAQSLIAVFQETVKNEKVAGEFGELMVSMGSSRSLDVVFKHISLPVPELWKPQKKQNEGFDFHTVCPKKVINFGEAKFLSPSASSPVNAAAQQANGFFSEEKHYRDRVHLVNLVDGKAIENLDQGLFGMVLSFSMNAKNPITVYNNAISKVKSLPVFGELDSIYIVGVKYDA